MNAFQQWLSDGIWLQIAPVSLPGVRLRRESAGIYRVRAYGGDEHGQNAPDDDTILQRVRQLVGFSAEWVRGDGWEATHECVAGEVQRTIEVSS